MKTHLVLASVLAIAVEVRLKQSFPVQTQKICIIQPKNEYCVARSSVKSSAPNSKANSFSTIKTLNIFKNGGLPKNVSRDQLTCLYQMLMLEVDCSSLSSKKKLGLGTLTALIVEILLPVLNSGSDKCEAVKTLFGLSFNQIQRKIPSSANSIFTNVSIDVVTKNGNVKTKLASHLADNLSHSSLNVILIHGYLESSEGKMVSGVAPEFLLNQGHNVFALDGRDVISLGYLQASTYVRYIGMELGSRLSEIIQGGQDPSNILLVGHSLGAHIAGIAGMTVFERTGRKLGRITGLDPALLCFTAVEPDARLDPSDADYVDVIHTNVGMLGLREPVGHKDFYPNSGVNQPGCDLSTCDHTRAWELYAESINSPKSFPARKCESWSTFQEGFCSENEVVYMGLESQIEGRGSYFLSTRSSSPFGLGPTGSG